MEAKPISSKSIARNPAGKPRFAARTDQERGSARLGELTAITPGNGQDESFGLGESASVQNASTASVLEELLAHHKEAVRKLSISKARTISG